MRMNIFCPDRRLYHEYQARPSTLTMLEQQRLPQPKELTFAPTARSFRTTRVLQRKTDGQVTAFIWRSTVDDMYSHLHATRTFYLIIRGMEGKRLNREMATLVNQLAIGSEFPVPLEQHKADAGAKPRAPAEGQLQILRRDWSVEVTFCPDQVVRITGWTGICQGGLGHGKEFVITKGFPPLLLTPTRTKHALAPR